jgi:hypothetical protein
VDSASALSPTWTTDLIFSSEPPLAAVRLEESGFEGVLGRKTELAECLSLAGLLGSARLLLPAEEKWLPTRPGKRKRFGAHQPNE